MVDYFSLALTHGLMALALLRLLLRADLDRDPPVEAAVRPDEPPAPAPRPASRLKVPQRRA